MNPFAYAQVETPAQAMSALRRAPGAKFVAGGTNLLDLMKDDVEQPPVVIDINPLPLRAIERRGTRLNVGALARMSDVADHPDVRSLFPLVAIALEESASPQLRNMASIGGNLLQRTRCAYFRDTATACNKRAPGSGCAAIAGVNRAHAILGTSPDCIATHPSDLAVALCAIGAYVSIAGQSGQREIALTDLYRRPGSTPHIETTLARTDLIAGISLPLLPEGARSTYLKVRDRAQYDFALASAAVVLTIERSQIGFAQLALGGVGTVPWRSPQAETILRGAPPTRATFERAARAALTGARGSGQNDFKIALAQRTLVRALEIAAEAT